MNYNLMQCVTKLFGSRRTDKYNKKSRMREVIKCHKAEMAGDYETAYKTLLNIVSKNVYGANAMSWSPSHNFTMIYNFPFECWRIMDSDARYAVAAVYNLYWMGFPNPCAHFERWEARFGYKRTKQFYLRVDRKHEHLGEMRIITKEEYDEPLKHRPELRCSFDEPHLLEERCMRFYSGDLEDMIIKYKVIDRDFKHNRVFLECEGHYYEYSWQFSLG